MYETLQTIVIVLLMGLWLFVAIKVITRMIRSKHGKVNSVKAQVIDKHIIETFSKYSGDGKSRKYVIVFEVNKKKRSFYVSEFSYGGYRVGEKGTLKYQGARLIDFS